MGVLQCTALLINARQALLREQRFAQTAKSLQRVVGTTANSIVGGQTVAAVNIYKRI